MLRTALAALAAVGAAVGMASSAGADKDEFSRTGCYVGASGSYILPYAAERAERELEDVLDDSFSFARHFGSLDAKKPETGWAVSGRAGCRNRWIGGELHFEWIEGLATEVSSAQLRGARKSNVPGFARTAKGDYYYEPFTDTTRKADRVWALTADAKFYPLGLPFLSFYPLQGRIQPFATVGFGYLKLDAEFDYGPIPLYRDKPEQPNPPVTKDDLALLYDVDGHVTHAEWDFVVRAGGGLEIYLTKHVALTLDAVVAIPTSHEVRSFRYLTTGGGLIYRF